LNAQHIPFLFCVFLEKTMAQVAIRWCIQRKVVSSVITGATSVQQLEDNMGASSGWALTDEEVRCFLCWFCVCTSFNYFMLVYNCICCICKSKL